MKTKVVSVLMALAMICAMLAVVPMTVSAAPTGTPVGSMTELFDADSYGNNYLTGDITITTGITLQTEDGFILDLNGYTITILESKVLHFEKGLLKGQGKIINNGILEFNTIQNETTIENNNKMRLQNAFTNYGKVTNNSLIENKATFINNGLYIGNAPSNLDNGTFTDTKHTPVSATVAPTYAVTVPASIDITAKDTAAYELEIEASGVCLYAGEEITVSAQFSSELFNGTDAVDYIFSEDDEGDIGYDTGDIVASFTADGTEKCYITVPDWSTAITAGTYTDTILFLISAQAQQTP